MVYEKCSLYLNSIDRVISNSEFKKNYTKKLSVSSSWIKSFGNND